MKSLDKLKQKQSELLLAEVAAWLHDIGKFCNLHIESNAVGGTKTWANNHAYKAIVDDPASQIQLSSHSSSFKKPDSVKNVLKAKEPKAADFISSSLKRFLTNNSLSILGESYTLAELIMLGTPGFATDNNRLKLLDEKSGWLAAALGICHNEAHVDKQEPAKGKGMQTWRNVFISNAFGFEKEKVVVDRLPDNLDTRLKNLPVPPDREILLRELAYGLGDTRRPINEVLLSDWSGTVASLFKSALASAVLNNNKFGIRQWKSWRDKIIDHDLRWRLLRVNFDVLALYAKSIKIADLLAYQTAIEQAYTSVKHLVEEEYPLGNEVYRDTTGIYFTFPDLDLPAELEQKIRRRVEAVEPELAPYIAVTSGKGDTAQAQLKTILTEARGKAKDALTQPFGGENLSTCWTQIWESVGRGNWEVCPVCGLRPKAEHAEVCEHCRQRRASRLDAWLNNPAQTIWLGEIADKHDRLVLLTGKFGLDDWLSGDLVKTMLVKAEQNNPDGCMPKNSSPARLRRVWETCQRFWKETVLEKIIEDTLPLSPRRLLIPRDKIGWKPGLYNGKINDNPLDLYWQPDRGSFLTVSNLEAAGELKPGDTVTVKNPDTGETSAFVIKSVNTLDGKFANYHPWLSLLVTPDRFMAILPASAVIPIVEKIQAQYIKQFGKVRNRLPLSLGMVFFERKMPLIAVLDAGRAMLDRTIDGEQWKVVANPEIDLLSNGTPSKVRLNLKRDTQQITVEIPTAMGDGETFDPWYPYWRVENNSDKRKYQFTGPDGGIWVHAKDLQKGDTVHFTPATFDFLWLDSAARRFDVAYDDGGRRTSRPVYLEQFSLLERLWKEHICQLSTTQIKQMLQTIESTRDHWFGHDGWHKSLTDETFRQFVTNTLADANWLKTHRWQDTQLEDLTTAAVRGELADWAELHLEILKEKPEEDPKGATK